MVALFAMFCAAGVALVLIGSGALLSRLLEREARPFPELIVIGLAPLAAAAVLLNFFTPLTPGIRLAAAGLAALFGLAELFRAKIRPAEIVAFSFSLLYFVINAVLTPLMFDTGYYQMQNVKWMEVSRLFPGLASVHTRLAFDSITLSAAALLHVSAGWNAPLLLDSVILAAAEAIFLVYAFATPREKRVASTSYAAVCALLMPLAPTVYFLDSLSTDIAAGVLILFLVFWLLRLFEGEAAPAYLALLPVLAVTAKLSAGAVAVGCAWFYFRLGSLRRKAVVCAVLLAVLWVSRNALLSGYLVYPVCVTNLHQSWSLLPWQCGLEQLWIRSWARIPGVDPRDTAGWRWIAPWFHRNTSSRAIQTAVLLALAGAARLLYRRNPPRAFWPLTGILTFALAVWFAAAPDLRFGSAILIGLAAVLFGAAFPRERAPAWSAGIVAATLLLSTVIHFSRFPDAWPQVPHVETSIKMVDGIPIRLAPAQLCWDQDPPCAPFPSIHLRPRQAQGIARFLQGR